MAKTKTIWCCSTCGHSQIRWTGMCPSCNEWNTLQEEMQVPQEKRRYQAKPEKKNKPMRLKEIPQSKTPRIETKIGELDRMLGGGIVPGSFILIGGDPGIGKSTLMLQTSGFLAKQGLTVLYVCGEESVEQTSLRAARLGIDTDNLLLLNETDFALIQAAVENVAPDILIVDSIQIVYKREITSAPGSVSQVRETAAELMHLAKGNTITTFVIGHVTKSGEIAGPRVLEHLVDTVLYFEGDRQHTHRMVRSIKNRFGPTDEIAVFSMHENGLKEVPNPSELFLEERKQELPGASIIPTIEGTRPILVEVQALVSQTAYPAPSRKSTGLDPNRLALLIAVLEKRLGYKMYNCDVFVSVAGGIKILEPAIDLGVLLSIASSLNNRALPKNLVVVGEVGLGGEIRSVPRIDTRLKEALQLGFDKAIIPKRMFAAVPQTIQEQMKIYPAELVEEAIYAVFKKPQAHSSGC